MIAMKMYFFIVIYILNFSYFEKFKEELPEFKWEERNRGTSLSGHYFVNEFWIDNVGLSVGHAPLLFKTLLEESENSKIKYLKYKFKYLIAFDENGRFDYDYSSWDGEDYKFESEEELDFFISAIRVWMKKCDSLRKSDRDEKQLVLIHPDLDKYSAPRFLDDLDYISDYDEDGWRVGVMNTNKWDLSKEDLIEAISDNSGDCFNIEEGDPDLYIEKETLEKFFEDHPEARGISNVYITDWD